MQKKFLIVLGLAFPLLLRAGDSLHYLTFRDTLTLRIEKEEKIYLHTAVKGQTLFSLAKFYGLHFQELHHFNPGLGEKLSVGQTIRIPIPNRAIIRYLPKGTPRTAYAPVTYLVKKGDTVFRVGQYFKLPTDTVISRGKIKDNILKPNMQIHVGWISTKGIPESARSEPAHPLLKKNLPLNQQFEKSLSTKKVHTDQGPAFWQKEAPSDGQSFYARFNQAPPRSVIEIVNPMNQGKIFAQVLGPIPPTVYDRNIKLVLSPAAARMLGARDPQFFVKIRYFN